MRTERDQLRAQLIEVSAKADRRANELSSATNRNEFKETVDTAEKYRVALLGLQRDLEQASGGAKRAAISIEALSQSFKKGDGWEPIDGSALLGEARRALDEHPTGYDGSTALHPRAYKKQLDHEPVYGIYFYDGGYQRGHVEFYDINGSRIH